MHEADTCLFYFVSISVTLCRLFYVNPLRACVCVSVCLCSHLLASALCASHGFISRDEFWSSAAERTQLSLPARRRARAAVVAAQVAVALKDDVTSISHVQPYFSVSKRTGETIQAACLTRMQQGDKVSLARERDDRDVGADA